MTSTLSTDVLIIGGGPSGMVCGLYLDRLGIPSIIVERRSAISAHPKAHELSARSIEILLQLGITMEELLEEAAPYDEACRIAFCHQINTVIGAINLKAGGNDEKYRTHLAASHPYLNISQTALEEILRRHIVQCSNTEIRVQHQWNNREERHGHVLSEVVNLNNDSHYIIESAYLICADGAASRSRNQLEISMVGADKINDFISVYFEMNLRDQVDHAAKLYWIFHPAYAGTFVAHHMARRWVFHFPIYTPYESIDDYPREVLQARIAGALGNTDLDIDIKSIGEWRMTSQIAEKFRQGRAFLVGDAAHRFPPTGGLGMNSGIGDAHNLCWKLAWVIRKQVHQDILETYELERRPVIERNTEESLKNFYDIWAIPEALGLNAKGLEIQAKVVNSKLFQLLPKALTNSLLQFAHKKINRQILRVFEKPKKLTHVRKVIQDQIGHFDRIGLDLGYHYEQGLICQDTDTVPTQTVVQYQPSICVGVRFPHFWVGDKNQQISSHEWVDPQEYVLLCNHLGYAAWHQSKDKLNTNQQALITAIEVETIHDKTAQWPSYYPLNEVAILVLRPDGHIAARCNSVDMDIPAIFNSILPPL